ncbi:MAG: glutaredoxin 3 [Nitrososphaerales archaeon]
MVNIEIYTKDWCSFCKKAKSLLNQKGLKYVELNVTHNRDLETEMQNRSKRRSVPQIFIDELHIGGFDDLRALERTHRLDSLIGEGHSDGILEPTAFTWFFKVAGQAPGRIQ